MSNYTIKGKFLSLKTAFAITGALGGESFAATAPAISWRKELTVTDANKNVVGTVSQKLALLKSRYEIELHGSHYGVVEKKFSFFKPKYELAIPHSQNLIIVGSFSQYNFEFRRGLSVIATAERKLSLTDTYELKINDGENDLAIICACLAINQINKAETKRAIS